MTYGIPYRGSKNKIAEDIIEMLPPGHRFVDLFAGGCAMTHAAYLTGKYSKFLCNDKYPVIGQEVFRQACTGEFNKPEYQRTISYDEFRRDRFNSGWLISVWGWNCSVGYLSKEIDKLIKDKDIKTIQDMADELNIRYPLQRLTRLKNLTGQIDISRVEFTAMDYRDYIWQEGDVVYCDPPYSSYQPSNPYSHFGFDINKFWEWVRTRDYPVYVSEYSAPDDFVSIFDKKRGGI